MKNAALVPSWDHEINNVWFFNDYGCDERQPRYCLKKYFEDRGVSMNTSDLVNIKEIDGFIVFNIRAEDIKILIKLLINRKLHKTIYYPIEPSATTPIHELKKLKKIAKIFGKVLTWNDDLVDNEIFFKQSLPQITNKFTPGLPFLQKKMLTMISGANLSDDSNELYTKRLEAIKYFEKEYPEQFFFYGKRWQKDEFKSYKGMINNKYDVYRNFKFAICYENSKNLNGYITEKIFDCFYSGIIPVYWGPNNVDQYIPKECYIDKREFSTYDELAQYLVAMSEEDYNKKLEAIESFLSSEKYQQFSPMHFAKGFYDHLESIETVKFSYLIATINLLAIINWLVITPQVKRVFRRLFKLLRLV